MKTTSKYLGIGSSTLTLFSDAYETIGSQNLTIGTTIDMGIAVLALTPFGAPIVITYSVADAILQVTTDKGCSDYINKASESVMGGSSIYSW